MLNGNSVCEVANFMAGKYAIDIDEAYSDANDFAEELWHNLEPRQKLKTIKKKDVEKCKECKINGICVRCPGLAYDFGDNRYDCSEWDRKLAMSKIRCLQE